jgi:pheromone shutdown-related protein TraB
VTLRRVYRRLGPWQRLNLVAGLGASLFSRERVTQEEIERLKQGDLLESTFAEFARRSPALYETLIRERDHYMAARLQQESRARGLEEVLVVVGAGHVAGLRARLEAPSADPAAEQAALERVPPAGRTARLLPWLVVALILAGFGLAFARSGALGWQLVLEWVLINGTLSALGTAVAGGHPVSVLSAFVAAPLTSLNPTVGAGMVVGAIEVALRRPLVSDFQRLRQDVARLAGWRRNRVARALLVFVLATLGSAVGTYLAGFRIVEQLIG